MDIDKIYEDFYKKENKKEVTIKVLFSIISLVILIVSYFFFDISERILTIIIFSFMIAFIMMDVLLKFISLKKLKKLNKLYK